MRLEDLYFRRIRVAAAWLVCLAALVPSSTRSQSDAPQADPLDMVAIPGGTFVMGSSTDDPQARPDEQPAHPVRVAPFLLSATEITQRLYREVMGENPSYFRLADELPVDRVDWFQALEFCNALSRRENLQPTYILRGREVGWIPGASGFRLPTEAEWEYACRAGTTTPYSTGACLGTDRANFDGDMPAPGCAAGLDRGQPVPVASFPPNSWGLHDMHGNVYEWCWDRYGPYAAEPAVDPQGATVGATVVIRGGGWYRGESGCRCAARYNVSPTFRSDFLGFRVARNAGPRGERR